MKAAGRHWSGAGGRRKLLDSDLAKEIIELREREFPLGFRSVQELLALEIFDLHHLGMLQQFSVPAPTEAGPLFRR
jgi:hypothetical protein